MGTPAKPRLAAIKWINPTPRLQKQKSPPLLQALLRLLHSLSLPRALGASEEAQAALRQLLGIGLWD